MTYEEFKTALLDELKGHFSENTDIAIHKVARNNQTSEDALTILEPGLNVSPAIYLYEYYKDYQNGLEFESVFQEILDTYHNYRLSEPVNSDFFKNFENISSRICFKLINRKLNEELLKDVPHVPFLDLEMVFYILVQQGTASILIRNEHCKFWGKSQGEIYDLAKENTQRLLGLYQNESPFAFMTGLFPYILTNQFKYFGAACILYDNLLADWAEKYQTDFIIIPSSIHEVLLVPPTAGMGASELSATIKDVNSTLCKAGEVLSDHAYYYSRSMNKILMDIPDKN